MMSTVSVDIRNLVYKLCEGREVPLLVTDIIAGYLTRRDLFNINILSRDLNEQANAIIYREVVVDLDGSEKSVRNASLLFRTLLTSETAAQAVRTLSLAGDPLQSWRKSVSGYDEIIEEPLRGKIPPGIHADLVDFTQGEIQLYHKVAALHLASTHPTTSEVPIWALYLHVFHLAPHVQDFSVSSDYFRFPDFRNTLQGMFRNPLLANLRSCSLCLDLPKGWNRHAVVVQDWDSTLLMPLTVPGIQSVAAVVSLQSEAVRQLHLGGSSITRLNLHHYQIEDFDLSSLLAATPCLRYLKYHATSDYGWLGSGYRKEAPMWEHRAGLEPLYDALHLVADNLQELHTSHDIKEDSCHNVDGYGEFREPIFRQRRELTCLKRLHALTMPVARLLGWRRTDDVQDWDNILPSSLRLITLTDDLQQYCFEDEWMDDDLMPVFSRLVEWLSVAQRGDGVAARFGLRLAMSIDDFNEPVRQQLTQICEERGVQCSIEKAHADVPKPPPRSPRVVRPSTRGRRSSFRGYR
jgi:hypothetical protein